MNTKLAAAATLAGSLAAALTMIVARLGPRRRAQTEEQLLRRLARRQERLRRRPRHHLRRHLQGRLPGQCLEIRRQGHLRHDEDAEGHGLAQADQVAERRRREARGTLARVSPLSRHQRKSASIRHAEHACPHLPAAAGVGFKPQHFDAILDGEQPIGFVEVHAENYMGAGGPPHAQLRAVARTLRAVGPRRRPVDRSARRRSTASISRG